MPSAPVGQKPQIDLRDVVRMTGIAFGWMGATTAFASVVRKPNNLCWPSTGALFGPLTPRQGVHRPAKANKRRSLSEGEPLRRLLAITHRPSSLRRFLGQEPPDYGGRSCGRKGVDLVPGLSRPCQGSDGYRLTEWDRGGMTFGQDNQGDRWTTSPLASPDTTITTNLASRALTLGRMRARRPHGRPRAAFVAFWVG